MKITNYIILLTGFLLILAMTFSAGKMINRYRRLNVLIKSSAGLVSFLFAAWIPANLEVELPVLPFALGIVFLVLIYTYKNKISGIIPERNLVYMFAFLIIYVIFLVWLPDSLLPFYSLALLIFAVADFSGTLTDEYLPYKQFSIIGAVRSLSGSIVYFCAVFSLTFFTLMYGGFTDYNTAGYSMYFISVSMVMAAVLTGFNLVIDEKIKPVILTLVAFFLIFVFAVKPDFELLYQFNTGMALALIVAVFSFRVKFLTESGAIATFLLAGFIFGLGGLKWSLPILTFFILSSLLSKIRNNKNVIVESYFEKSGTRDFMQVFANGGIGGILVMLEVLHPSPVWFYAYIASLAAVCADTWSTETGTLKKNKTYNILTFRPVPQGMSGGVSVIGTLGGAAGAFAIALSGVYWFNGNLFVYFPAVILTGLAGSFVDSVLGATFQVQYRCEVCNSVTERKFHCDTETIRYRGFDIINNDFVNLLAGVSGGLFMILIWGIKSL